MPIVDVRGAKEMVRDLKKIRETAVPYGMRNGLNTAAFEARRVWQREIKASFTTRNSFTTRSVQVVTATTKKLEARVGSTADFMGEQETGKRQIGRKAIPAPGAAGQPPGGKRTRVVRGPLRISAIKVDHPTLTGGRKQRNAIRIAVARRAGHKFVLLERPRDGEALFRIGGGRRTIALRMLWVVGRQVSRSRPEPTLQRTLNAMEPKLDHMLSAAMLEQLQRIGVPVKT